MRWAKFSFSSSLLRCYIFPFYSSCIMKGHWLNNTILCSNLQSETHRFCNNIITVIQVTRNLISPIYSLNIFICNYTQYMISNCFIRSDKSLDGLFQIPRKNKLVSPLCPCLDETAISWGGLDKKKTGTGTHKTLNFCIICSNWL